jgi:hypothetical protein
MEDLSKNKKEIGLRAKVVAVDASSVNGELHPAWQALIRFCRELKHGEIERINIQDGLPVSAEVIRKKIRWC